MRRLAALLLLAGCRQIFGIEAPGDVVDAAVDAADAQPPPIDAPAPQPVVMMAGISTFTLDNDSIYFAAQNKLWRVPKAGGTPVPIVDTPNIAFSIAVDQTTIYWPDYFAASVFAAPKTGGSPTALDGAVGSAPQSVVLDGTRVYYPTDGTPSSIFSVAKTGGPHQTEIGTGEPDAIAVDSNAIYWVSGSSNGTGTINRLDKVSRANVVLATPGVSFRETLAIDATDVYAASQNAVFRIAKTATNGQAKVVAGNQPNIANLALGATSVFWTSPGTDGPGSVMRAPKAGGPPAPVAQQQPAPSSIVVDGNTLYWVVSFGIVKLDVPAP